MRLLLDFPGASASFVIVFAQMLRVSLKEKCAYIYIDVYTHLLLFYFNVCVSTTYVSLFLGIRVLAGFLDASRLNSAN